MPSEVSVDLKRDCIKVDALVKNKVMLSSNTFSLSTGNAPHLKQLDNTTICRTVVSVADDVSLSDNSNPDEAFPVIVSAMEETMQTTDADQSLTEQSSSRLTPISILTADTVGALRSQKNPQSPL